MGYVESDLVRIAKRENNTKRGYIVVDPLQGKHVPVSPSKALKLFECLADTVREEYAGEKLLIVGFAETATAIGARVAVSLGADFIQTTREAVPDAEYLFFSEEHSHATEQKLVRDDIDAAAGRTDRIVFVEDEVTTGKTILNIISILEKEYPGKLKFSVASLLNGMTQEHLEQYSRRHIRLHYLVKTDHSTYDERAGRSAGDGTYYVSAPEPLEDIKEIYVGGAVDARRLVRSAVYENACEELWKGIFAEVGKIEGEKVLVIGTEETMYPALYVGKKWETEGNTVFCHSTTRSPIAVSREPDYPLHTRYELKSLYDSGRRTFIYDIGKYDRVVIVTDAPAHETAGAGTLAGALRSYNKNITIVRWCRHAKFLSRG